MDWHGLTWIGIDYPAFQTKLSVRGMCLKKPCFVCYHPDCQEPLVIFERWGGLLKHNNKDHRNRSGFVDLSKNSKDSGYKARLKLKHAYWFSSRKVVVEGVPQTVREKGKQLDHNELQELENGQDVSCKKRKVSSAFWALHWHGG
jgi:hypothetical protein